MIWRQLLKLIKGTWGSFIQLVHEHFLYSWAGEKTNDTVDCSLLPDRSKSFLYYPHSSTHSFLTNNKYGFIFEPDFSWFILSIVRSLNPDITNEFLRLFSSDRLNGPGAPGGGGRLLVSFIMMFIVVAIKVSADLVIHKRCGALDDWYYCKSLISTVIYNILLSLLTST